MILWFALHPATYFDTFGRWFLHQAYIRSPWSLVVRSTNWFSLAEWASIYWNFFDPTHLFYGAAAPARAGYFPAALGGLLIAAGYDLARPLAGRPPHEAAVLRFVSMGFVASPLVPALFSDPGGIQKAIGLVIFGSVLCAFGVRVMWTKPWTRIAAGALLALALVQSIAFYAS
jgi:hypothetical protein